jgi:hypothetical protein
MQRLLAYPVTALFFFIFGLAFSQFGYAYLKRGSFQYTPEHGPMQIIAPTTNATAYWTVTGGMLAVGGLFIAIAIYAAVCLFRACRAPEGTSQQSRFGILTFAFAIFIILFALIASMCSRQ